MDESTTHESEQVDFEPVDLHRHGVGRFDFGVIESIALGEINDLLAAERTSAVLTFFIPPSSLHHLEHLAATFASMKKTGRASHIRGISLEGPLLSTVGGTPNTGTWLPTKKQWEQIASLGSSGLAYTVLAPDADVGGRAGDEYPKSIEWICDALLHGGVLPALGHFSKASPTVSSQAIQRVLARVQACGKGPIVTDHLFNDTPLNFRHAWRRNADRATRDERHLAASLAEWAPNNLESRLGPVPAALIRGAWDGHLKIAMNFDGAHVDPAICRRAIDLIGPAHIIMMTDSIPSAILGGVPLQPMDDSGILLCRPTGVVAGGTTSAWTQVRNLRDWGLPVDSIAAICRDNALSVFQQF